MNTLNPALKAGLELDAVCERYWNAMFPDGWSWVELITGTAGNNERVREVGRTQAEEIRAAMMAAIAPLVAERDELLAAAKMAEELIRNGGIVPIKGMTWVALNAAIAKAEGHQ